MITYKEFQIKVMTDVFKKKTTNTFEPSLYMVTKEDRNKIGPLPGELFSQKEILADICKEMNKLAGSKYCCFVSECNFTKIDKEACDAIGVDFDKLSDQNISEEETEKIRKLSSEALVFNFESLTDNAHICLFKNINGNYMPTIDIEENVDMQNMQNTFSNLLCK